MFNPSSLKMKEKIKNALKTEYAKLGLGDKAFDGVASFLVKTIAKEEDIDGVIKQEDTAALLKAFQGESDSLRTRNAQLTKDLEDYKKSHPDTKPGGEDKDEPDEPEWARKLREQNEALSARLDKQDKDRRDASTLASVRSALEKAGCNNKGILNLTLKGFSLGEKETEDEAVARLTADYNANVKDTFGEGVIPPAGGGDSKPDQDTIIARNNDSLRKKGLLPKEETK